MKPQGYAQLTGPEGKRSTLVQYSRDVLEVAGHIGLDVPPGSRLRLWGKPAKLPTKAKGR